MALDAAAHSVVLPSFEFFLAWADCVSEVTLAPELHALLATVPVFGQSVVAGDRSAVVVPNHKYMDVWWAQREFDAAGREDRAWAEKRGKVFWRGAPSINVREPREAKFPLTLSSSGSFSF